MNTLLKTGMIYMLCLVGMMPALAQTAGSDDRFNAAWTDSRLTLTYRLAEPDTVGCDYAVCSMPCLVTTQGDTIALGTVMFRGKRNRQYVARQRHFNTMQPAMGGELPTGTDTLLTATFTREAYPQLWSGKPLTLYACREKEGCCNVQPLNTATLGTTRYVVPFVPLIRDVADNTGKAGELQRDNPVLRHISEYVPYDNTRVLRKEKGALYVHFPLDKAVLHHDFRSNAPTLDKIVSITRDILADSTSSVKIIQIVGLASVEGTVKRNLWLGEHRAQALKQYIQQHVAAPDSLFECVNGGEAWAELRDQVNDLQFDGRDQLLQIIDSEPDADRRERRMKQLNGGKAYAYLKDNVLRDQRNSGYLRIYYDYVPDHAAATINRASQLLREQRYAEALDMLQPVKHDPRALNALGVALYMTGDKQQARSCFERSAAQGNEEARKNLEGIKENNE